MNLQKVKGSVWGSGENLIVENIAALRALPPSRWNGCVLVLGHSHTLDGGGGLFSWTALGTRSSDDNGIVIDPTGTKVGLGVWLRVVTGRQCSLAWFGANDRSTSNLLSKYGLDDLIVNIVDGSKGGSFRFSTAQIPNHDGINNFNGWVRVNDPNFTQNINMNGNKITGGSYALGGNDYPVLDQVKELVATGDFVGIIPQYSPRYTGDGATSIFSSKASDAVIPPDPLLVTGPAFEVTVNGLKVRHIIDFTVENNPLSPNFGKIAFVTPPAISDTIDIVWFAPIMLELGSGTVVTATISGTTHTLDDWFGEHGADITIKATGTTGYKTLGDRFASDAVYFEHEADMVANHALYKTGSIVVTKGRAVAGDGFIGTYFIKSKADADNEGIDYTSPQAPNIFIPGSNQVAVFQSPGSRILEEETHVLGNGQKVQVFSSAVDLAQFYINGLDVDQTKLLKGIDYSVALDKVTVTLAESYPTGTTLTANWVVSAQSAGLFIDCGTY